MWNDLMKEKKNKKNTCLSGVSECSDFKLNSSSWLCCSLSPATRIAKWWLQTVDRVLLCGFRFLDLSSSSPGHCVLFCFFFSQGAEQISYRSEMLWGEEELCVLKKAKEWMWVHRTSGDGREVVLCPISKGLVPKCALWVMPFPVGFFFSLFFL